MARGGFVGSVTEMKKGPDDGIVLLKEVDALLALGNYRPALQKLKPALAASQTNGDDVGVVNVRLLIIACHARLQEVGWRSGRRGFEEKADESLS